MEQIRNDIQNVIKCIQSNENANHTEQINTVMSSLVSQENQTHEIQLYVVLLQFVLNSFSIVFTKVNHIKQDTKKEIDSIIRVYNNKPYANIDDNINEIKKLNNDIPLIAPLIEVFMTVYRKKQLTHISKFYSTIKLDTLSSLLGKEVELDEAFFNKVGWINNGDHVVITREIENKDIKYDKEFIKENIVFIENMNIQYEQLIKRHKDIKAYSPK